jgi:hypothetical protein
MSHAMKDAAGKPTAEFMKAEVQRSAVFIEELKKQAEKEEAAHDEAVKAVLLEARAKDMIVKQKMADKIKEDAAQRAMDMQGKGKDKRTMMQATPKAKCKPKAKVAPSRATKEEEEDAEKEDEDSWGGWTEGGYGEPTDRTKGYELTVANVGGHTHMYLKEIVLRRGITAQPKIKTKEGEDTAVVSFRTKEEAQTTLEAMEQYEDEIWPKMKWNWKAFNIFGDVYTKNPITPTGSKKKKRKK